MREQGRRGRGERGFTLIETAVALLVMLVAGLAAMSLFVYSIRFNTGAHDRAVAQALAQRQMEVLRKTAFDGLANSTQTITNAGRQYRVDIGVCNDGSAACGGSTGIKQLTVTVTPLSGGPAWALSSVQLITLRGSAAEGSYF